MSPQEKINQLKSLKYFVEQTSKKTIDDNNSTFYIKGTRIFVTVSPSWFEANSCTLRWGIKNKHKKGYRPIDFSDVLELDFVNKKALKEIIFNLHIFAGK